MEALLAWFESIPNETRTLLLVSGFVVFWALEGLLPLYRFEYRKGGHALLNLFFWATTLLINLAFAFALVGVSDWASTTGFGLVNVISMPLWLKVVSGLLLLDLVGAWLIHWLEHRVRWMWKFHLIHHTDAWVDVTTGLRHHPGESVFRAGFTVLAATIVGAPVGVLMLYQSLSALFAQLTHANVRVPDALDRLLSWVIVTPNMHKVHHHESQPFTDTNYGNIFAVWDRLFGTFAYIAPGDVVYGIDTHRAESEHNRMGNLLAIPFQAYRPPPGTKFSAEGVADQGASESTDSNNVA